MPPDPPRQNFGRGKTPSRSKSWRCQEGARSRSTRLISSLIFMFSVIKPLMAKCKRLSNSCIKCSNNEKASYCANQKQSSQRNVSVSPSRFHVHLYCSLDIANSLHPER